MISAVEKSPDTPIWDEGQVEQIRQAFLDALHADGLTVAAAAKLAGIAEGTLSLWKGRSYAGRNDKIADKVSRWLDFRQDKQLRARELIAEPPFQRTKSAERLLTMLDYAQMDGDIVVAGWGPGCGKSATCRHYQATRPRVTLATMAPSSRGINTALVAILLALGEKDPKGTPQALSRKVSDRYAESGGMLIIDEAQHLSQQAIDELRSINDRASSAGVTMGLAFVGHESVFQLFDAGRNNAFAQFSSRIGMRDKRTKPLPADVEIIAAAWGVADAEILSMLKKVAMLPGGLRGMGKVLKLATRLARIDEAEPPSIRHINDAFAQLSPGVTL